MPVSELRKALTTGGTGQYLVPQDMEPIIRQDLLVQSPLATAMPLVPAAGSIHTVVKRTAHNSNASFKGEMSPTSYSQSTYARRNVSVKIISSEGQVSDFQHSAAKTFTDSLIDEIQSATVGFRETLEFAMMYGTVTRMLDSRVMPTCTMVFCRGFTKMTRRTACSTCAARKSR
jgi:hypothetical protein